MCMGIFVRIGWYDYCESYLKMWLTLRNSCDDYHNELFENYKNVLINDIVDATFFE